jgi:hypothetical protein
VRRARVFAVAALVLVAACSSAGPARADEGRSIASAAGLSADVAQRFALALQGPTATYTLTYATTDAGGKPTQLTVTQQPPDRRVDVFAADGTIESTFRLGSIAYQCTKTPVASGQGAWVCGTIAGAAGNAAGATDPLRPHTVRAAVDAFKARAADYEFRVEARTIVGVAASCLVTSRKPGHDADPSLGASATLCLAPDGAVLSVEVPTGSFTATAYSSSVDVSTLELPAPPDGPASSSASS